jgi:hypothetical protein
LFTNVSEVLAASIIRTILTAVRTSNPTFTVNVKEQPMNHLFKTSSSIFLGFINYLLFNFSELKPIFYYYFLLNKFMATLSEWRMVKLLNRLQNGIHKGKGSEVDQSTHGRMESGRV